MKWWQVATWNFWCYQFATHKCGINMRCFFSGNYPKNRGMKMSKVIWVDECCITSYTDTAGYAKNTISWDWLVEKVFAVLNNEVKECWLSNIKVLWTKLWIMRFILTLQGSPWWWRVLWSPCTTIYKKICLHK